MLLLFTVFGSMFLSITNEKVTLPPLGVIRLPGLGERLVTWGAEVSITAVVAAPLAR